MSGLEHAGEHRAAALVARPLTRKQREALDMIRRSTEGEVYLLASDESFTESGVGWTQAFIHWRTATALAKRGLVRIDGHGEDATVYLTEQGGSDV